MHSDDLKLRKGQLVQKYQYALRRAKITNQPIEHIQLYLNKVINLDCETDNADEALTELVNYYELFVMSHENNKSDKEVFRDRSSFEQLKSELFSILFKYAVRSLILTDVVHGLIKQAYEDIEYIDYDVSDPQGSFHLLRGRLLRFKREWDEFHLIEKYNK